MGFPFPRSCAAPRHNANQIPEVDGRVGETPFERLNNLTYASKGDLMKVAVIPDNKRDWIQDVP